MDKSPDAFRTISEVADWLGTPTHVLRFWESRFTQIKPVKRAGGRRYYRPADMALLGGIKKLLHDDGLTIRGVQKILREQGVKHVSGLSQPVDGEDAPDDGIEAETQAPRRPAAEAAPPRTPEPEQPRPAAAAPVVPPPAEPRETFNPFAATPQPDPAPEAAPEAAAPADASWAWPGLYAAS